MLSPNSRVTRGHSCVFCQQRKVRCDGHRPCSTCLRNRQECVRRTGSKSQARKNRDLGVARVIDPLARRLELCERAVQAHGITLDERGEPDTKPSSLRLTNISWPAPEGRLIQETAQSRYVENPLWQGLTNELDSCSSVADESENEMIQNADAGTLLLRSSCPKGVRSLHPETPQVFQLWQIFLNNVNPIVKLLHAPSTQQLILEAASDLDHISRPTEALLFSLHLCAVASMNDETSRRVMGASRSDLMARFSRACEQALINANFLRSTNLLILQALTLYLLATRQRYDVQTRWLLTGIASRIARVMGLHRERSLALLPVFEREMRRRLWWQILLMDSRAAQLCGVAVDAYSYHFWDTERPCNVSDSDLSPSMQELPRDRPGTTEMLFCEIRFEIGDCMRKLTAMEHQPVASTVAQRMIAEEGAIDALESRLEDAYLKDCDPSIPFHQLALYLARSSVCQMRLATRHPRRCADLSQDDRDRLFSLGLQVLTYDNLTYASRDLQPYLWHVGMSFPFEAFILVVTELSSRREGERVDQAWAKVDQAYHDHADLITASKTNTLFFALGTLTLRAWDMRMAWARRGPILSQPVEPQSVARLRALRGNSRAPSPTPVPVGGPLMLLQGPGSWNPGESDNVLPCLENLEPSMDLSQIDWECWQNLIHEHVDFF
ncbi:unnamed protein product [Penicillium salamii]|uniref:Zn(2)-C6 fungal-type domain-containing protein n=1 Tax=Penicillium salamii TaxID=1612424 RepID=A0A9W4NTX5_9EURO|nr:unnamed protein product [Penicillium salamii]CAG8210482.1 unnamed protein product [Penicillium salamii]CAG8226930.1 unnamed protein product [Penicillium salamii]CAG8230885.1 unnamed protein product [Penicillium salamii]CAG8244144.1 unnamed protein product [Penicillium salamii]